MAETVRHNRKKHRFEVYVDEVLVGHARYQLSNGVASFDHTEIDPDYGGRGLASKLVSAAFDEIQQAGEWRIRPACRFVVKFARKHPEYSGLLVH